MTLPPRPPLRGPAREEIRGRDGEILNRNRIGGAGFADPWAVPTELQDSGWSRQWVRVECINKPDPANVNAHLENGWRPVTSTYSPKLASHFMGAAHNGAIIRDGLMLCERPQTLTDQARREDIRLANEQRHNQAADFMGMEKLIPANSGFEVKDTGRAAPKLKRSVEKSPSSLYPKRELALGDD